jgi:hypothetical protein
VFFQKGLQGGRIAEHRRADFAGDQPQDAHPVAQLMIHFSGKQGNRRHLLVAQDTFHILTQHLAGVERQRPDADQENGQHKKRDSGLDRSPVKDRRVHVLIAQ